MTAGLPKDSLYELLGIKVFCFIRIKEIRRIKPTIKYLEKANLYERQGRKATGL
jgi:hypothetical protein